MRVYAVADIHGKKDRFERIRNNLSDLKADILVIAGDITNFTKPANILSRLNTLAVPVLVTHPPPYGCRDLVMGRFHAGSKGLLKLIKKRQPQIMICGHIHEDNGVSAIGKTHVVNCALNRTNSGALIMFENGYLAGLEMI